MEVKKLHLGRVYDGAHLEPSVLFASGDGQGTVEGRPRGLVITRFAAQREAISGQQATLFMRIAGHHLEGAPNELNQPSQQAGSSPKVVLRDGQGPFHVIDLGVVVKCTTQSVQRVPHLDRL